LEPRAINENCEIITFARFVAVSPWALGVMGRHCSRFDRATVNGGGLPGWLMSAHWGQDAAAPGYDAEAFEAAGYNRSRWRRCPELTRRSGLVLRNHGRRNLLLVRLHCGTRAGEP
jgi:hypothetical protein